MLSHYDDSSENRLFVANDNKTENTPSRNRNSLQKHAILNKTPQYHDDFCLVDAEY